MKKKIIYSVILLIILFFSRYLDFFIFSKIGDKEHFFLNECIPHYKEFYDKVHYESIGFCSRGNAKTKLMEKTKMVQDKEIFVLKFFDLIHPTRYLVYSKGKETSAFFPWPGLDSHVNEGLTEINIFKFEYAEIKTRNNDRGFFTLILGFPYDFLYELNKISPGIDKSDTNTFDLNVEFPVYYYEDSLYIKDIYFFYFFPPFIAISLLISKYRIHLAYFYFVIMTLLFSPKYFMFYAPSLGLGNRMFGYGIGLVLPVLISVSFGILFLKNIKTGLRLLKEKRLEMNEKYIILYFLLLPLFLRF